MTYELSVAIIFKNEIRCIERCLKSLLPLKERFSCEVVMADTGSTDGSRAVAERYADIVFDFPWIDDFAAARNAVLSRCRGAWVLVMDCDEWLDPMLDALTDFLREARRQRYDAALVTVRNYVEPSFARYADVTIFRLLNMASAPRYVGVIHEQPTFDTPVGQVRSLSRVILHHDGYVMLNDGSEEGKKKRERNRVLIRKELEHRPNDLHRLMQYLEAYGDGAPEDYFAALRHALLLVEKKVEGWRQYGPPLYRYAVFDAYNNKLPELEEWSRRAKELFPDSYFTRIDVGFILFIRAYEAKAVDETVALGEDILNAERRYAEDARTFMTTSASPLQRGDPYWAQYVRFRLAEMYQKKGEPARAKELLGMTDWTLLDERHTTYFIQLLKTQELNGDDIGLLLSACWIGIHKPIPSSEAAAERVAAFRKLVDVEDVAPAESEPAEDVPPELLQLAEKVKAILAKLPPDDPIAVELKSSEAYQKVKHLIEG
ncbi:MAG: glycosyltransferase [Ruminococcaceae bacterium]|nr:glycosyltransferase [Oscillospiraceae bacterium]